MRALPFLAAAIIFLCTVCGFAQTPSPALLVLNKGANELAIVDPATMKVVGRVPVGQGPHEVATDGKLAFVGNYGAQTPGNSISIIDLATQKEIKRVDLGALRRPHGMVAIGGKAYFTAEANKLIGRLDPQAGAVDWLMGTGQEATHMLVVNKDETRIFTANIRGDSVSVLERVQGAGGWTSTVIPVGKGPEAIDMSPDGREVWTAHSQDGGVSIIDVETRKVKQTLPALTKHSNRLKFTPDGKRVLISDAEGGEVVVLDAETRKEIKRIKTGGTPLGIQMQPDGARAFVALSQEGAVAAIDLKTLEVSGKVATGPNCDGLAWVR